MKKITRDVDLQQRYLHYVVQQSAFEPQNNYDFAPTTVTF